MHIDLGYCVGNRVRGQNTVWDSDWFVAAGEKKEPPPGSPYCGSGIYREREYL